MLTVWKFPLPFPLGNVVEIEMPARAEILHVGVQGQAQVCVWAKVDPEAPLKARRFRIAGTGHALDGWEGEYLGTVQIYGQALVFHVFGARQ